MHCLPRLLAVIGGVPLAGEIQETPRRRGRTTGLAADRLAVAAIESVLMDARADGERGPALELVAGALAEMGIVARSRRAPEQLHDDLAAWLVRLRGSRRSESSMRAYRVAVGDLLAWASSGGYTQRLFEEATVAAYLDDYRRRCSPAPATYHRRFVLIRHFMRWVSQRSGLPDPFLELPVPPRPRHAADWLTREEFARLLEAAGRPERNRQGLAERDQLVLLALVLTGLRRSELIVLDWRDVTLRTARPSLLVRQAKNGRSRRQPIPTELVRRLEVLRSQQEPAASDPVFRGLGGGRLQPTILASLIRRAAVRAGIEKTVTAHTLRHTAATWLREATGDARLVAEYLGHADLSTVIRYAHVAPKHLQAAAEALADAALDFELATAAPDAGKAPGEDVELGGIGEATSDIPA